MHSHLQSCVQFVLWRGLFAGGWVGPMWREGVGPATRARRATFMQVRTAVPGLNIGFLLAVQCARTELSASWNWRLTGQCMRFLKEHSSVMQFRTHTAGLNIGFLLAVQCTRTAFSASWNRRLTWQCMRSMEARSKQSQPGARVARSGPAYVP